MKIVSSSSLLLFLSSLVVDIIHVRSRLYASMSCMKSNQKTLANIINKIQACDMTMLMMMTLSSYHFGHRISSQMCDNALKIQKVRYAWFAANIYRQIHELSWENQQRCISFIRIHIWWCMWAVAIINIAIQACISCRSLGIIIIMWQNVDPKTLILNIPYETEEFRWNFEFKIEQRKQKFDIDDVAKHYIYTRIASVVCAVKHLYFE